MKRRVSPILASVIAICATGLGLLASIETAMAGSIVANLGACINAGQEVFAGQYRSSIGSNPVHAVHAE